MLLLLHVVLVNVVGNAAVANVPVNVGLVSSVLVGLYSFVYAWFSERCAVLFLVILHHSIFTEAFGKNRKRNVWLIRLHV